MAEDGAGPHGQRYPASNLGLAGKTKQWLFANGVTLNQEYGSLVVPPIMEELARNLVVEIQEGKKEHSRLTGRTMS
jgi:hypothetical protein